LSLWNQKINKYIFLIIEKKMTEQQQHLANLLEQRTQLDAQITQNRELFWKVQGAIEYLTQIGVTLPEPEQEETPEEVDS
jgi:hypothetical protein